jgi:hypothetical protein
MSRRQTIALARLMPYLRCHAMTGRHRDGDGTPEELMASSQRLSLTLMPSNV